MLSNSNYAAIVDALGRLMAKKAELEKEEKQLKNEIRALGPGAWEGRLFRATVSEDGICIKRDAIAMRDKLWSLGYYAFVKAHEHERPQTGAIRIVARSGRDMKIKDAA